MTFEEFHNGIRVLHNLEREEIRGVANIERFMSDPVRWFISADDDSAHRVFAMIEAINLASPNVRKSLPLW